MQVEPEKPIPCQDEWHALSYDQYAKKHKVYPRSCPRCHSFLKTHVHLWIAVKNEFKELIRYDCATCKESMPVPASEPLIGGHQEDVNMSEREKLISELEQRFHEPYEHGAVISNLSIDGVADFIIADRKRIVEPLVKAVEESDRIGGNESTVPAWQRLDKAVYETLKLAGEL
jgi:hypothetical protein